MAAIGSKRKRFVGDGNDAIEVSSLVKSMVALPLGASGARVHPSPGAVTSSRLVVQTDLDAVKCTAFVASAGAVFRHEVPFAGGVDFMTGKEAMLKPVVVNDGRGLHSFASQLNLSDAHGIGGARRGCVAHVKGLLGGV
jgi:hypothetical protein